MKQTKVKGKILPQKVYTLASSTLNNKDANHNDQHSNEDYNNNNGNNSSHESMISSKLEVNNNNETKKIKRNNFSTKVYPLASWHFKIMM